MSLLIATYSLFQHYYPEGGWGFFVTFCAVCCHAISIGFQIYLSNIIFHRFHTGECISRFFIISTESSKHSNEPTLQSHILCITYWLANKITQCH